MKFTDLFVKRPVLASVISILILVLGLRAIFQLPLRQFPEVKNTVISVMTTYPGANAQLVQGFITSPLQKSIAGADGIDYMTATSSNSVSTIKAYISTNYSPDQAMTNIMAKVAEVRNLLPRESNQPVITKAAGHSVALMYIGFQSERMSPSQTTDYITRVVQPKLETIPGVATAEILGGTPFAMRIWLNPKKMAALNVSAAEVMQALQSNNFQSAAGQTKGEYVIYTVNADTDLKKQATFENLVVKHQNGGFIRLRDVAKIQLGAQNYDSQVEFNGKKAVFIAISATPSANPLTVIDKVRAELPKLAVDYPPGLSAKVVYDSTKYIKESIHEVIETIVEATIIVILVIFLFLGALRTVMIPVVTIPLSLIGVASAMLAMGYSLNLLTLLAMVLAIGLVVDDAIIVVENVYRHIENGETPFKAALHGAREIATPVIAMTITLAAVYAPIGFMQGLTGALFSEFAFTLAFSVVISGVIALTLSPMMCSKVLNKEIADKPFVKKVDRAFDKLKNRYQRVLSEVLDTKPVAIVFAIIVLLSCVGLFVTTPSQLAPTEDQSVLFMSATAPEYASLNYLQTYTTDMMAKLSKLPQVSDYFIVNGMGQVNNAIGGLILKPWGERSMSQAKVKKVVQGILAKVSGLSAVSFALPSLPGNNSGLPVQFVVTTTSSYKTLYAVMNKLEAAANKSGLFIYHDVSLKYNKPQLDVHIDRNKAAELGVNMQSVGTVLAAMLGGNYVNRFGVNGQSYEVIPQVLRRDRMTPAALNNYYVPTVDNQEIPLSTIATIKRSSAPNKLEQFQQLNSATFEAVMTPGHTLPEGLHFLESTAKRILPQGFTYDFAGQSRQVVEEGNSMMLTFAFALLIIYLVLAAQFESFRDPWIVLVSVPMSICGALIPLNAGAGTLNIYTEIGLVTLIGLISKHGILLVDFANKIQKNEGLSIRAAIEKSAGLRLRPILMTTVSMIIGVLPLLFASGAGAVSRFDIGMVIAAGMFIGTLFTIFIVPTVYVLFAKDHRKDVE